MAAARPPVHSMTLSTRPQAAPSMLHSAIGGLLELMIHAVETWRDRRVDAAR